MAVQAPTKRKCQVNIKNFARKSRDLFPQVSTGDFQSSYLSLLMKKEEPEGGSSNQRVETGEKYHPFNMRSTIAFKNHNVHHSTCIEAKVQAIVGLGHENDKVKEELGPLTSVCWSSVLQALAEDFCQIANSYLEVVWNRSRTEILGLHFLPGNSVTVVIENSLYEKHYKQTTESGDRRFAAWGDGLDFYYGETDRAGGLVRAGEAATSNSKLSDARDLRNTYRYQGGNASDDRSFSELIHIMDASSLSRYYGYPSWLSAVASIELVQALMQHQFDFHLNRGVPEFMLFLLGAKVGDDEWAEIEASIDRNIGLGNTHKSMAVNLDDPNLTVQLEKLAMERSEDGDYFKSMMETLALNIVSAHRVPPILAGILIPGKLGATNETPNAILAFQALVIGPAQETLEAILDDTLGDTKLNGQLKLKRGDFKFKTIVDEIAEQMKKLKPMDTLNRSREQLPQQAEEERDLDEGIKKQILSEFLVKMVDGIFRDAA